MTTMRRLEKRSASQTSSGLSSVHSRAGKHSENEENDQNESMMLFFAR